MAEIDGGHGSNVPHPLRPGLPIVSCIESVDSINSFLFEKRVNCGNMRRKEDCVFEEPIVSFSA